MSHPTRQAVKPSSVRILTLFTYVLLKSRVLRKGEWVLSTFLRDRGLKKVKFPYKMYWAKGT